MILYHGTSDYICSNQEYLMSQISTNVIREKREQLTQYVFLTDSKASAEYYAKKAADKFGGNPIIFKVKQAWNLLPRHNHEYLCSRALIDWKEAILI